MKKILMPALIMVMGAGAAFATKPDNSPKAIEKGSFFANGVCNKTEIDCDPVGDGTLCTYYDGSTTHNLKRFVNNTSCDEQLYKPIVP